MLKIERDLARQIKELMDTLHETQRQMRLSPDHIQNAVEVALQLAQQPTLIPTEVEGIWPDPDRDTCPVFQMPSFTGSWERCLDGIHHPHTGEARPVVFDHKLAAGREDVVLVHLNHPLVQMGLRLLRAEVWSTEELKKLNRITARVVPDHVIDAPAMIAHARLVLIGGDSYRLHEELITAGGLIREGRFSRMNVGPVADALAAITAFQPHMHMLGTYQCLELIYPWPGWSAQTETVSCAKFNYNWHLVYNYDDDVAPIVPAGTVLHVISWHDNTEANRANPDPKNWTGDGGRTIDEMGFSWIGWYDLTDEEYEAELAKRKASQAEAAATDQQQ